MKKFLILILLGLVFSHSFAQSDDLQKRVEEYFTEVEAVNVPKFLDMMYPPFFTLAPRELMIKTFKDTFENPDMEIKMFDSKILNIGKVVVFDSITYSKVKYSANMTLKYTDTETDYSVTVLPIFKNLYGNDNVSYDTETKIFKIILNKSLMAIKTPYYNNWSVIGIEEAQKPMLKKILPSSIIDDWDK